MEPQQPDSLIGLIDQLQDIVEPATVVHHATPHRGDPEKFWAGPFERLCKPHHDSHGQLEDHGKHVILFGPDGWPIA